MSAAPLLLAALVLLGPPRGDEVTPFDLALRDAEKALASGDLDKARERVREAIERDPKSPAAWELRARWAEKLADADELVWSLHWTHRLLVAQKAPRAEIQAIRERLVAADPIAPDLLDLHKSFVARLEPIAKACEKDKRPHAAIRIHKEILVLDPERAESLAAIERLASSPDPSLAGEAKPKDLLAGVSQEWIAKHDKEHAEWKDRARLERENYTTYTDAGYEVLVRAAEAMEQMNAFYRQFFRYGTEEDKGGVSRIDVRIFKTRDEYLEKGEGPPVKWSGGQFTGGAVETYIDPQGGFEGMTTTLFHEAAHQFVSLATTAEGWLNEGLASFFEGTRVLANGSVIMNLPANQRLFPLVERMKRGWMKDAGEGIDPEDPNVQPSKSPTFAIVLENRYEWGPAWYAPTWGVVYFLYNYQDPVDGRFVYRSAFQDFIDSSGGRMGEGAVTNFEEVVLANPQPPTAGVEFPASGLKLPRTAAELDPVWMEWMTQLSQEQSGNQKFERPYLKWARCALTRKDWDVAAEHFEKGLLATPDDVELLLEFGEFLFTQKKNGDRAALLAHQALRALDAAEGEGKTDAKAVGRVEQKLAQWDPKFESLERVHTELWAACTSLAQRYLGAARPLMAMDVSWRLGTEFRVPGLADVYAEAARSSKKTIWLWKLAYNEQDMRGWSVAPDSAYRADKKQLVSAAGPYQADAFAFQFLGLDTVSSGDFSLEAEIRADSGAVNFCGLVFGRKSDTAFHAAIFFPPRPDSPTKNGFLDLTSFFGSSEHQIWRHVPAGRRFAPGETVAELWYKLRIDLVGPAVDVWFDGKLVATQEFSGGDVLRGSFGLISGPGTCAFRNVRYLDRPSRDPGAAIERQHKLEELGQAGAGAGGSWLGAVPPWPKTTRWVQGERKSWDELGPVPQLLVFWSIEQNDLLPIDEWLAHVAGAHANVGLAVVNVVSHVNDQALPAYLETHAFPGAVAVDARGETVFGQTFVAHGIETFHLPRILLLDVDHKVIWEGDPGFKINVGGRAGDASFLDDPLAALIQRRKLVEFHAWAKSWREQALPALERGDFAAAVPVLRAAADFDASVSPAAADAVRRLAAVGAALDALPSTIESLSREEAEPALAALQEWGAAIDRKLDKKQSAALKAALELRNGLRWKKILEQAPLWEKKLGFAKAAEIAPGILEEIAAAPGRFPRELAADMRPFVDAGDWAAAIRMLQEAKQRPARWLAQGYFGW